MLNSVNQQINIFFINPPLYLLQGGENRNLFSDLETVNIAYYFRL